MRGNRQQCSRRGFTLVEILVALAVVATAATILVSLFGSTLMLSRTNRSQSVAASLAEEQLDSILRNVSDYAWSALDGAKPGQLVEVVPVVADAEPAGAPGGRVFDKLVAKPADPGANAREENFYDRFRWQAYAALPEADSRHVEVTVVVRWRESGKDKSVALTSSAPRFSLESRPLRAANPGGNA